MSKFKKIQIIISYVNLVTIYIINNKYLIIKQNIYNI